MSEKVLAFSHAMKLVPAIIHDAESSDTEFDHIKALSSGRTSQFSNDAS
jgi:hypothetical protein